MIKRNIKGSISQLQGLQVGWRPPEEEGMNEKIGTSACAWFNFHCSFIVIAF